MKILLPGLDKLIKQVNNFLDIKNKNIVIYGVGAENAAIEFAKYAKTPVEIIVEDYEQFINSRLNLKKKNNVVCKLMDFAHTDYSNAQFDVVFAQASISSIKRKLILKEIKRILKPEGFLVVGEIVSLKQPVPKFVQNLFDAGNLAPLPIEQIQSYYEGKNWEILHFKNFSETLKEYFTASLKQLNKSVGNLTTKEKSYHKKLLNRIKHESNVYLKLGGNKYIGFVSLILQNKK